jgi:hypothetical protein
MPPEKPGRLVNVRARSKFLRSMGSLGAKCRSREWRMKGIARSHR